MEQEGKISELVARLMPMPGYETGDVVVYVGTMFGDKSAQLIVEINRKTQQEDRLVDCFYPHSDTRVNPGFISSRRNNLCWPATPIPSNNAQALLAAISFREQTVKQPVEIVAVDEAWLFEPEVALVFQALADSRRTVLATVLSHNYMREPWPTTLAILGVATEIKVSHPVCREKVNGGIPCRHKADFALYYLNGQLVKTKLASTVNIENSDNRYVPVCRAHYLKMMVE